MIPAMLSVTALIAYFFGSVSTVNLCSNLIFHCNIAKEYPRNNEGITRFRRRYGVKGTIAVFGIEILKTIIPVLIGGLLMNIAGYAEVGYVFAMFCVVLGTVFPIIYEFKGETSLVAIASAMIIIKPGVAIIAGGAFVVVYLVSRYVSLSAVAGAVLMWFLSIITLEYGESRKLMFLVMLIVIIENRKSLVRIIKHKEEKFVLKKDVSYLFDE